MRKLGAFLFCLGTLTLAGSSVFAQQPKSQQVVLPGQVVPSDQMLWVITQALGVMPRTVKISPKEYYVFQDEAVEEFARNLVLLENEKEYFEARGIGQRFTQEDWKEIMNSWMFTLTVDDAKERVYYIRLRSAAMNSLKAFDPTVRPYLLSGPLVHELLHIWYRGVIAHSRLHEIELEVVQSYGRMLDPWRRQVDAFILAVSREVAKLRREEKREAARARITVAPHPRSQNREEGPHLEGLRPTRHPIWKNL